MLRVAGVVMLSAAAAFYKGDAEALYPNMVATMAAVTWFGPINSELNFDCKPGHKATGGLIVAIRGQGQGWGPLFLPCSRV